MRLKRSGGARKKVPVAVPHPRGACGCNPFLIGIKFLLFFLTTEWKIFGSNWWNFGILVINFRPSSSLSKFLSSPYCPVLLTYIHTFSLVKLAQKSSWNMVKMLILNESCPTPGLDCVRDCLNGFLLWSFLFYIHVVTIVSAL